MNLKVKTHLFIEKILDTIFPVRLGLRSKPIQDLDELQANLLSILDNNIEQSHIKNKEVAQRFIDNIDTLYSDLQKDLQAIYNGDPSAKSINEIILTYPGFQAIACYRMAHYLLNNGVCLIPRLITEYAHSQTGIDIHPGAEIGHHFCIDHGTGIVIGETTIIGNHVKIYQGVTLGALSIQDRNKSKGKRHPSIGHKVVIYAHAIILGGETTIGDNSIVGGNVWLTESIPANSKIYFDNKFTRQY
ncbi:MAG: serine acetyltransferase [Saprospiraceae bacterium]|nr:serine acetyltransferase [Bacteroidia bacterium]NNE16513.1 serine acetyltransferase [Saprospiraceae bacterium]NNL92984.1 serine acetyltransferase [Saprospiraceae bacterium]